MSPKMHALVSAVLPQDLDVRGITEWGEPQVKQRRREGRVVGRFLMAGLAAGAALSYLSGHGIPVGLDVGGAAGLLLGWCMVGWRRWQRVA